MEGPSLAEVRSDLQLCGRTEGNACQLVLGIPCLPNINVRNAICLTLPVVRGWGVKNMGEEEALEIKRDFENITSKYNE